MAKLVDATDSKSVDRKVMLVQVRLEVPKHTTPTSGVVFYLYFKRLCWFDNCSILEGLFWKFIELLCKIYSSASLNMPRMQSNETPMSPMGPRLFFAIIILHLFLILSHLFSHSLYRCSK